MIGYTVQIWNTLYSVDFHCNNCKPENGKLGGHIVAYDNEKFVNSILTV